MGKQDNTSVNDLMLALVKVIRESGKKCLIVASSDLSHFHDLQTARKLDFNVVNAIKQFDYFKLGNKLFSREWEACGGAPVVTAMMTAEQLGATDAVPALYQTSANVPAGKKNPERVVGYLSCVILKGIESSFGVFPEFSDNDRAELFQAVKKSISASVKGDSLPPETIISRKLSQYFAAFVTLKKNGQLRGCMGHTVSQAPLINEVIETARMAALGDPRFGRVKESELDSLEYEISILSRMNRVLSPDLITPGLDGVYLRFGQKSALFLPQVAAEQKWDKQTLLEMLCRKADLPLNSYKNRNAELFIFRAIIIN
jgi:hypothetical protein